MSLRSWGYVVALGLALAVPALADPPEQYRAEQQRQAGAQNADGSTKDIEDTRPDWLNWFARHLGVEGCGPYPLDRLGRLPEASEDDYRSDCDLEAQESVAHSTRWLLAIAALQTGLGVVGTILVWRTLRFNRLAVEAAQTATQVSREIGEAQVRAYVSLNTAEGSIVWEQFETNQVPIVSFRMRNSGSSPALNLRYIAALSLVPIQFTGNRDDLPYPSPEHPERSDILSAGDTLRAQTINVRRWNEDVMARLNDLQEKVIFYGKITYDDVFGKSRQTRFCYQMDLIQFPFEDDELGDGQLECEWVKIPHHNDAT